MDKNEIFKEEKMKYDELVSYLKAKYGSVPHNYFVNEKCKTKNKKNSRTDDGLFIHHIKENEYIMLCETEYAIKAPFQCQYAENLVYCNYIEHLLLHKCIVNEFLYNEFKNNKKAVGIGGICNFIAPMLNGHFLKTQNFLQWQNRCFNEVYDNYNEYINILKNCVQVVKNIPEFGCQIHKDFENKIILDKNKTVCQKIKKDLNL